MKGTTYDKSTNSYKAQIRYNDTIVNLGKFHTVKEAANRYKAAFKAVEEGVNLFEWLELHPNKKTFENAYFEFESNLESDIDKEPISIDGYHLDYGFSFNRMKWLQDKYKDELKGKDYIVKEDVLWFDFSGDLFRKKLVNWKYWQAYLKKIGMQVCICNPDITPFELKNSLLKVMQKKVYIPKNNMDDFQGFWGKVREDMDEVVQESIYGIPTRKFKKCKKIIFNPDAGLSTDQRQEISRKEAAKTKANKTLNKLTKFYKEGMSKKGLAREAKADIKTVRTYWDELQKVA